MNIDLNELACKMSNALPKSVWIALVESATGKPWGSVYLDAPTEIARWMDNLLIRNDI